MHNAKLLYHYYETFYYRDGSAKFLRKTWITMLVKVYLVEGKKKYVWSRARTAKVCRCQVTKELLWGSSENHMTNSKHYLESES